MKKLTKEEIEKAISEAIVAHNDLCANDIECIPHHRVMPIVSKALSGVGEEECEHDWESNGHVAYCRKCPAVLK